jgi:broad specificity phosphatase PhoE
MLPGATLIATRDLAPNVRAGDRGVALRFPEDEHDETFASSSPSTGCPKCGHCHVQCEISWKNAVSVVSQDWRADAEQEGAKEQRLRGEGELVDEVDSPARQQIFVVRHGDRQDKRAGGAESWAERLREAGFVLGDAGNSRVVVRDPPLSPLGFAQARETGLFLRRSLGRDAERRRPISLLCSPYLRCLQTAEGILEGAALFDDDLTALLIEEGLSETYHEPVDSLISQQLCVGAAVRELRDERRRGVVTALRSEVAATVRWSDASDSQYEDWREHVRVVTPGAQQFLGKGFRDRCTEHYDSVVVPRTTVSSGEDCGRCEDFPDDFYSRLQEVAHHVRERDSSEDLVIVSHAASCIALVSMLLQTGDAQGDFSVLRRDQQHIGHIDTCGVFRLDRLHSGQFMLRSYSHAHADRTGQATQPYHNGRDLDD